VETILKQTFLNNSVLNYLIAIGIFLIGSSVVRIFILVLLKRLKKLAKETANTLDDFLINLVEKLGIPFLYLITLYVSIKTLNLNLTLSKGLSTVAMGVLVFFIVRLATRVIAYGVESYLNSRTTSKSLAKSIQGALKVIKFIIWSLALVFFLDNLGFKISTVIAGLGIGGIAIALAAQAVLGDLFSYFSIIFDRPFEIGDFVIVGDLMGTIEHIGIKTTRVRSLGGEQLIFPNSDLTGSRLRNYKRMQKRRVVFKLGVTYDTPLEKLKEIPSLIENEIKKVKDTLFDRAHFSSYGDFSLIFEVVYSVLSSDYNKYMDIQQQINFAIKGEFEQRKIEFAFPTQTVYLNKSG